MRHYSYLDKNNAYHAQMELAREFFTVCSQVIHILFRNNLAAAKISNSQHNKIALITVEP